MRGQAAKRDVGHPSRAAAAALRRLPFLLADPGLEVGTAGDRGTARARLDVLAHADIRGRDVEDVVRRVDVLADTAEGDPAADAGHIADEHVGRVALGGEAVVAAVEHPVADEQVVDPQRIQPVDVGLVVGRVAVRVGVGAVDVHLGDLDVVRVLDPQGPELRLADREVRHDHVARVVDGQHDRPAELVAQATGVGHPRLTVAVDAALHPAATVEGEVVALDDPGRRLVLELDPERVVDPVCLWLR